MGELVEIQHDAPPPFDPIGPGQCPGGLLTILWCDDRVTEIDRRTMSDDDECALSAEVMGFVTAQRLARGLATWLVHYDGDTGACLEAFRCADEPWGGEL